MTREHLERMAAGRERWLAERRLAQLERVEAFQRWLREGAPVGRMPVVPRDADFKAVARELARR